MILAYIIQRVRLMQLKRWRYTAFLKGFGLLLKEFLDVIHLANQDTTQYHLKNKRALMNYFGSSKALFKKMDCKANTSFYANTFAFSTVLFL